MSEKKSKVPLKEKFVSIYETFFKAEDFSLKPAAFWDELFLLKINSNYIISEFRGLSSNEDLIKLKKNINFLYNKGVEYLKFETNHFRLHKIVHTLYLLTFAISTTPQIKIKLNSIETLEFLIGIDNAVVKFQTIFDSICSIITNDEMPHSIKKISLKYLLTLATQCEAINDNLFIEHFMLNNNLFEAIIHIVSNPIARSIHGRDALLLLTILLQYHKYESENPYVVKLSILDDEMALTGLAQVMSSVLAEFNKVYGDARREQDGEASWWNNVGNMIGNMFIGDEERRRLMSLDDSVLLVFYEAVHLNRNFISTLTHAATEFSSDASTLAATSNLNSSNSSSANQLVSSSSSTIGGVTDTVNVNISTVATSVAGNTASTNSNMRLLSPLSSTPSASSPLGIELSNELALNPLSPQAPSNLLVIFLQSSSALMLETKIDNSSSYDTVKLLMLIIVCISEDQYANSLLHDSNLLYSVYLYQAKLRHRKIQVDKVPPSRQLACSVLDLVIEFIQSHLMKNFPFELYGKSIGIIQRLMCYQKKYRIRLEYNWQNLWTSLISTLKFLVSYEATLLAKGHNVFILYSKIVVILNIFITYGDTFLPNPESYDYLYYDLMRMKQVFDNLLMLLNRYVSVAEWKEHVIKLMNKLSNIKSIINHFSPKIDAWSNANHVTSLTEQQVLDIVRNNYESLTLKLEDDLDQYERYAELPNEISYFSTVTRRIVSETRASLSDIAQFDQINLLSIG